MLKIQANDLDATIAFEFSYPSVELFLGLRHELLRRVPHVGEHPLLDAGFGVHRGDVDVAAG